MKTEKNIKVKGAAVRITGSDRIYFVIINIFLLFILVVVAIPLWSTITLSMRPPVGDFSGTNLQMMFKAPWEWSFAAYRTLLGNDGFLRAFMNSFQILAFGVIVALFFTIPMAYALSVKTLPGRKLFSLMVLIPYLFQVGLIPTYLVVVGVGLSNTLASVYLPVAISVYNLLIMRKFFEGIPDELKESARIDGASEFRVLIMLIIPLSKPIIMTVGLFYGVAFWNNFFNAMLYIHDDTLLVLPVLLRNILLGAAMSEALEVGAFADAPLEAIRAASVFLAAVPMVIAYPFIQKYFTKGTLIGSVKG
ncbi:MAG: carbohydrate ABC transporter permease [Treponema sp.]|jgi:putative aldouronate transport system permease protein|nr:carbohydrate ABC transporter permease [Treponema sp.]